MSFVSTTGRTPPTPFREAVFSGLAPDGGLYVPARMPSLSPDFLEKLAGQSLHQIGEEVIAPFVDDIPRAELQAILKRAWDFPIPLVHLGENLFLLELFHGPTLAFKDVGARFLAHVLSHYLQASRAEVTIAVATSGDTGSAVAHGFFGVPHISVFILYPSGKISRLQEQQMATLGENIHALEVEGTFDDCQRLVKQALGDEEVVKRRHLTTANSISLGRLLPQIAYHVWALGQWQRGFRSGGDVVAPTFVVPTGNFGNLTAAVYARSMGAPIGRLIAATNTNDAGARYLRTGTFTPRMAVPTYSNAMDVGNPSNLVRLQAMFGDNPEEVRQQISAVVVSDEETLKEIRSTYERTGRVIDPHTAVGIAAARQCPSTDPVIAIATAHPGKFPEVIERALGIRIPLPDQLAEAFRRPKQSARMAADYSSFRSILMGRG